MSLSLFPLSRARTQRDSVDVAQREAKLQAFFVASISSGTGEHGPKAADLRWSLHGALLLALSLRTLSFSLSFYGSRWLARSLSRAQPYLCTVSRFFFFFNLYFILFSLASPLSVLFFPSLARRRDVQRTAVTRVRYK